MNKTAKVIIGAGIVIIVLFCCCGIVFFALMGMNASDELSEPETAIPVDPNRLPEEYPLPGMDNDAPTDTWEPDSLDVPIGGLGNDQLRQDVWTAIQTVTDCPSASAGDIVIVVDYEAELSEFWFLYCPAGGTEDYYVSYVEELDGVTFAIARIGSSMP